MKGIFRGILFGLFSGVIIGWLLAREQQRWAEEARRQAYLNDPELVAIRKEIALERQIENALSEMGDGDDA